jgi:hypothetical protein
LASAERRGRWLVHEITPDRRHRHLGANWVAGCLSAQLVETLAEAERLFPAAAIWNDRPGSALIQFGRLLLDIFILED